MLKGYTVRKTENIYLEDLPLLKDPAWAVRELEHINFDRDRLHPSGQVPEWISSFIATHYASGLSFSWRHFLDDIKNGRAVMVRDSFYGPELCSVMASKDKARSDLPLALRQRVTWVLTQNVKRPISSLGPLQALIESPMFPPALRKNSPEAPVPIRDGVFIWTETVGAGHAYISVHQNNQVHLYTYGRFGRTGPGTLTGDGVLNYLTGEDAEVYYLAELYEMGAKVFRITDVDITLTRQFFEGLWGNASASVYHKGMGEATQRRGRTIDTYDLSGSNCVTHSVDGIQAAGSQVFKTSYTPMTTQFPIESEEDFTIPVSLQRYLLKRSRSVAATTVFDVTSDFKKQYPNITKQERKEGGIRNTVYEAGTESAAALGSLYDESGGTVGGVLGSSYQVE